MLVLKALRALIIVIVRVLRVDIAADLLLAELALFTLYTIAIHVGKPIKRTRHYHLNQRDD